MGLENRDYLRDEERRYGGGGGSVFGGGGAASGEWAIRFLLIANVIVFIAQNATTAQQGQLVGGLTDWLDLNISHLMTFQVWRLVTYGFCHGDLMHLLFNMFGLWMFGRLIQGIYGSKEFLLFYLTGVVLSGLGHLIFQLVAQSGAGVIGASGGVFAVVILTARHFPDMTVLVMFIIPMRMWTMAVLFVVLDLLSLMNEGSDIAHAAHLAGAAFGYIYFQRHWRISPLFNKLTSPMETFKRKQRDRQRKKEIQIMQPNDEDLRDEVDRILSKIHQQGEASLTQEERDTLERASRLFRGG